MVPRKGLDYPEASLAVEAVCEDLRNMGYKRVAFRCDGEPAIMSFLDAVKRRWDGEVVPENSPPGEKQSNGAAEKAVQSTKAITRSAKLSLEANLGRQVPDNHVLLTWIVNHGTICHRRFAIGPKGRTAFQNLYGRSRKV